MAHYQTKYCPILPKQKQAKLGHDPGKIINFTESLYNYCISLCESTYYILELTSNVSLNVSQSSELPWVCLLLLMHRLHLTHQKSFSEVIYSNHFCQILAIVFLSFAVLIKLNFSLLENHQIFQASKYAIIESEFHLTFIFYIYNCVDYNEVIVEMSEQAYVLKVSKI